jgi:hypothetical protein
MTTSSRLMAAGMPPGQAVQIAMESTPAAGLVGTGTNKASAVQLIAGVNIIATIASAGVSYFQLPVAEAAPLVAIENQSGTAALVVAAGTTDTINALSAGASFSVTGSKNCLFIPGKKNSVTPSTGLWVTILST